MSLAVAFSIKGVYQHTHVLCQSVTMLLSAGSASVDGINIDFIHVTQHGNQPWYKFIRDTHTERVAPGGHTHIGCCINGICKCSNSYSFSARVDCDAVVANRVYRFDCLN